MMAARRVLVLSVSAGAGHVRAAQALCAVAEGGFPDLELQQLDVMGVVPSGFRRIYRSAYLKLVEKAPLAWAYLYQRTDHPPTDSLPQRLRRHVERVNTRALDTAIERFAPDAIVCTHFLPAELLSRRARQGRPRMPVWVHVTDFDVHGMWICPDVDGYFVATDEVAARLRARGVPAGRIHVTGIAVSPRFGQAPGRVEAAAELDLDPSRAIVLMLSGGAGVGDIESLVEHLAALPRALQIVALAGRNEGLLERLSAVAARYPARVRALGFTDSIERVMAAADLAITKPGGLTTAECLAMQLPMIVVSPIPGQEERNADMLLEAGCAVKAVDPAALTYKLEALLDDRERLARMRERQCAVARPRAAQAILEIVRGALVDSVQCPA